MATYTWIALLDEKSAAERALRVVRRQNAVGGGPVVQSWILKRFPRLDLEGAQQSVALAFVAHPRFADKYDYCSYSDPAWRSIDDANAWAATSEGSDFLDGVTTAFVVVS